MKRVAVLLDAPYGRGGAFQYNQQLLSALISMPSNSYTIETFYVDQQWANIIPNNIVAHKIDYPEKLKTLYKVLFTVGAPDTIMRYLYAKTDLSALNDSSFDLVFFPSQDLAGLFLNRRCVNVIYDLMHRYESRFKEATSNGRTKFRDRLFERICRLSKCVLVDSETGKQQAIESYAADPTKFAVLPFIAPAHITHYDDSEHLDFFESLNLPRSFIFYPAQFWAHKNHKVLLEAGVQLVGELPDIHFIFTGPKKFEYNNLLQFCKDNNFTDHVTFLDYVPNEVLGGFYKRATAMFMPTFFGPTNIPPLEAIAMQCPVAVSRIYGMPEQLKDASLYFDNSEVSSVVSVMRRLWTDDKLKSELRERQLAHFAKWNEYEFAKRVHEIVADLCKSNNG